MSDTYTCPTCKKKFSDRDKVLECEICKRRFHALCHDFTTTEYNVIQKKLGALRWYCPNCEFGAEALYKEVLTIHGKMKDIEDKIKDLDTRTKEAENAVENKIEELLTSKTTEIQEDLVKKVQQKVEEEIKSISGQDEIISNLKQETSTTIQKELAKPEVLNKVTREMSDRDRRRNNIILHGVQETKEDNKETRIKSDESKCTAVVHFLNDSLDSPNIKRIRRLGKYSEGKNRPVLMELHDSKDKETILTSTRKLKGSQYDGIGISHDLTDSQRKELQTLVADAKNKSSDGKVYRVTGPPGFWRIQEKEPPK